jgi:hypothetical protein
MLLFDYQDAKRLHKEHIRRSLANYELLRRAEPPAVEEPTGEADVIELVFGAQCEHQIGA